jgi:hypothetical protein
MYGILVSLVDTAPRLTGRTATVPAQFDCLDRNELAWRILGTPVETWRAAALSLDFQTWAALIIDSLNMAMALEIVYSIVK